MSRDTFQIRGRIVDADGRRGIEELRVQAWDKDLVADDPLGSAVTDHRGRFRITFTPSAFRTPDPGEPAERRPDIFFRIFRGNQLLKSTEDVLLWNASRREQVVITMEREPTRTPPPELTVQVEAVGPDGARVAKLSRAVQVHPRVQEYLRGTRSRLLSFVLLDADVAAAKERDELVAPERLERLEATFYDYTNNRALVATGPIDSLDRLDVEPFAVQPLPNNEEFAEAVALLETDPELRRALADQQLVPYRPMPAVVEEELPDGTIERTLAVGLRPTDGSELRHEIVGVNMIDRRLIRYEKFSPPTAHADHHACNPPATAGQSTAARGTAGKVRVTVKQGSTVLWTFDAVRPAASSGTNGSGVELRFVNYRGKRVLYRAHVPILNVRYDDDACGPYRDWQWQEGMLQANGTDVAPGFRLCPTPAKTILDLGNDSGNFLGTAIYVSGQEVVLVNEMHAGWYRYVSEWRFHADGTIRPRFGFDAVANSCTCLTHHHHVYWRLDFDIHTVSSNRVEEFNDPPLVGSSNWHTKSYEIRRPNDPTRKRKWRITNTVTSAGYTLAPGGNDGTADSFGVGDLWVLRYRGSELDDGQGFTTSPNLARANVDKFRNGEHVDGKDVVIWYAAHFRHAASAGGGGSHVVGPDLTPHNW